MTTLEMPTSSWYAVEDNPRQRDTVAHAAKAKHLLTPSIEHSYVHAARLPGGKLVKLDGHTRAYLWQTEKVPAPKTLHVSLYDVPDLAAAKELYTHFDSDKAVERGHDKVSGALREQNINATSGLLRSGRISNALRVARRALGFARRQDVYRTTEIFAGSLKHLDTLMLAKNTLSTGMVAAILLTVYKHGEKALPFWRAVIAGAGTKIDGEMDGIQAACEVNLFAKGRYGETYNTDICQRAVAAYEKWSENQTVRQLPRKVNLRKYFGDVA